MVGLANPLALTSALSRIWIVWMALGVAEPSGAHGIVRQAELLRSPMMVRIAGGEHALKDPNSLFVQTAGVEERSPEPNVSRPTPGDECPANLQGLMPKMEKILSLLRNPKFNRTMRESLSASIPDAIRQIDDLDAAIAELERDLRSELQRLGEIERIARQVSGNFFDPLEPCRREDQGGYCSAVEEYHTLRALTLAHRAFLEALQCHRDVAQAGKGN